ncbi:tetratricopeptide repeat protein [Dapis sp. BLCC M126]|uniref:tetratricopeptide repeat protein n=1 Tax=Dapis sp. BLCC M126 TaxID=3400189 RepID=UPI003CE6B797
MVCSNVHETKLQQLIQTGDRLFDLGKFETALKTFQEALEIALTDEQILKIFNRIGLVYRRLGNYNFALKYLKLALHIAKEVGNQYQVLMILNDIGETHSLSIEYSIALRYYAKALEISQNSSNLVGMGITLNHLGEIYNLLGLFDQSLNCCQKSMDIFYKVERKSVLDKLTAQINIALALHSIGEAYLWLGQDTQAREILELTLAIRHKICKVIFKHFSKIPNDLDKNILHKAWFNSKKSPQKLPIIQQEDIDFTQSIISQHGADLANTMNLIEKVYHNLGQWKKADECRQQKIKILENCSDKSLVYNVYILPFYLRFNYHHN